MIGASKILTVSYGTFSCTLEGFDDSFGTMKAIAEYFRDLAADDRYFGAEPATPDAEMLAKIAGREIQRQVEAKVEDNGVTLRPIEQAVSVAAPVEQAPEPQPQPEAIAEPVVEEPVVDEVPAAVVVPSYDYDDAQDDARAEFVTSDAPIEGDTESVAAKLRRIRAVVAKNQAVDSAAPIFSEDQHADSFDPQEDVLEEAPEEETVDVAAEPAEEAVDVAAEPAEEPVVEAEVETAAEPAEETAVDATEEAPDADISAMMGRVSDEVADVVDAPQTEEQDTYDEVYEDADSDGDDAVSNILDQVAKDDDNDDVVVEDTVEDEIEIQDELIAEDAAEAEDTSEAEDEALVETADEIISEDAPQEPVKPIRPTRARIIKVKKADLPMDDIQDDAEDEVADYTSATDDIIEDEKPNETALDTLGETNLSAEDEAELLADLADVEKEASADVEMEAPADVEMEAPDDVEMEASDDVEMEAPADVEMEASDDVDSSVDSGIDAALRIERTNRALHSEGGADDEASVSRLLGETNAKLDTNESSRRRSAISHLRAAVAATVAERKFNKANDIKTPDEVDAYRTDLADVMRPQHVKAKGDSTTERPAPLILVSEQRIDSDESDEPSVLTSIRPRRISKNDVTLREVETGSHLDLTDLADTDDDENGDDKGANIFADSTSFADFAEKMGATELPDLLEAAAAYTAYVEGRPHFARPQIMRQVAGFAGKDEFNREEGLRSFGQLLRQGKIIKIKRGQFEIAETTRFKPEARIAGE